MSMRIVRSLHVPLPDPLYQALKAEAARAHAPATTVAREAIEFWLKLTRRAARHREIAAYAKANAGTRADLDRDMEAAGIEYMLAADGEGR